MNPTPECSHNCGRALAADNLEVVHLGQEKRRVFEAERTGVKSVPALVLDNHAYHINFVAKLDALK